jgi:hypothetical protein
MVSELLIGSIFIGNYWSWTLLYFSPWSLQILFNYWKHFVYKSSDMIEIQKCINNLETTRLFQGRMLCVIPSPRVPNIHIEPEIEPRILLFSVFRSQSPIWSKVKAKKGMRLFEFAREKIHWFPSHMRQGIDGIRKLLPKTSIVLEVRDSRISQPSALIMTNSMP